MKVIALWLESDTWVQRGRLKGDHAEKFRSLRQEVVWGSHNNRERKKSLQDG